MKKKWISLFISGSFLLLIVWFSVCNFPVLKLAFTAYGTFPDSMESLSTRLSGAMKSDDLFHRDELLTLNGLYGRMTERRLYNDVIRMKNGMLNMGATVLKPKTMKITEALSDLNTFVEEQGGKFLYVQFPGKYDRENELMPDGLSVQIRKEITGLVEDIRKAGVDVLDLQPVLAVTAADIEENFYRTDHHWKPSAAFKATRMILDYLETIFPGASFKSDIFDEKQWTLHEMPDQFLGSMGRRVGAFFGGVDDLEWITPNFETNLSFYCPDPEIFLTGDYETSFIRNIYLKRGLNKMRADNYFVYVGDNYPLIRTRNTEALSERKLLLIHDSFSIPVLTYLSLAFREVNSIDPRYYDESSIKEFVNWNQPDIVIMALSTYPNVIDHENLFAFSNEQDALLMGDVLLFAEKESDVENGTVIFDQFENGQVYTLRIPGFSSDNGVVEAFSVDLYEYDHNEIVSAAVFESEYCNAYSDCEWTFETPVRYNGKLQLRIRYEGASEPDATLKLQNLTFSQRTAVPE